MDVGAALRRRCFRLDADEAAGDMTGVEDPVIRVAAEDRRNLFLGGKLQKGRFVEARANDRRLRLCLTSTVRGAFCWTVAGGAALRVDREEGACGDE